MLSLSQTFSEAMGGEWRLFVPVLLTEPTLSQLIHGRWHRVPVAMELVVPDPQLDMVPSALYPQAWSITTGFSMSESVQLEPSVV